MTGQKKTTKSQMKIWKEEGRFKELTAVLEHRGPEKEGPTFSLTTSEGRIITEEEAEELALSYYTSFYEENPEERLHASDACGRLLSEEEAAQRAIDIDGYKGVLNVSDSWDGEGFLLTESYGIATDEGIGEDFPDAVPHLKYHLNHINAGCKHQRELGWDGKKDIALSKDDVTEAQRAELMRHEQEKADARRERHVRDLEEEITNLTRLGRNLIRQVFEKNNLTVYESNEFNRQWKLKRGRLYDKAMKYLRLGAEEQHPVEEITSKVYTRCLGAPCPECGYCYGSAWVYEPIPQETLDWFESFQHHRIIYAE